MSASINQDFKPFGLIRFAFPSIIMMVFMSLYTIIDGFFVSRFVGSNALSALNIAFPPISVLFAFGIMLATGGSAVVATQMGEGKRKEALSNFSFFVVAGLVISIILTTIVLLFPTNISLMLGASDILLDDCNTYMVTAFLFSPFCMLQGLFQSFFITAGRPKLGLVLTIFAGITNAVLDFVFIALLQMGVLGAALATGIGQMVPSVCGIVFFFSKRGDIYFTKFICNFKSLGKACANGASEMVTNLSTAVITFAFNIILMQLAGESGVAAISILLYAQFLFNSLYLGFSIGVAPIISFQHGAEEFKRLRRVYKTSVWFIVISSAVVTILSYVMADTIVKLFVENDIKTYELASTGFLIFATSFLFSGFNVFSSSLFTALSDGKTSAIISFTRTFVFIMAALLVLPLIWGVTGVWLAIPVAEFLTLFLSILYNKFKILPLIQRKS
ncbi:MAG: MATE family efflux transporter [Ruminococcus sp.]|nr:MATE family efflux transporter [Ruminococcus sp.]